MNNEDALRAVPNRRTRALAHGAQSRTLQALRTLKPLNEVEASDEILGFLSTSEWRVVVGYARDLNGPQIAEALFLALDTVKSHAASARRVLAVKTAQGLVAEAFRRGWLK